MNLNLALKIARDRWRSTAVFSGALMAYVLLLCAIFPSFQKMTGVQEFFQKNYPETIGKFFGVSKIDISSFNNFMVVELLGVMWVVITVAYVISFAKSVVAGELEEGTLEFLLAQPIERWKVLVTEGAVLAGGIVVLVLSTVLGVFVFGSTFGISISYSGFLSFLPLGCALLLAIAGYSLLFSALFRESRRALMASAGLTLAFYLLHFGGNYSRVVERIDFVGIFKYYIPLSTLESGTVPVRDILVLLAFAAAGFVGALLIFRKKDIT